MTVTMKKSVALLLVVFVGYFMFTDPNGFATFAKEGSSALWSGLEKLFAAIIQFLDAMFG